MSIGQAFCGDCGTRLQDATPYADRVAASGRHNDERKQVSILFADIVGSTAMVSRLDPEQSATVLDPLLREMAAIVARHGGFISGLRGDGLKAVFGMPQTREDHAERACAAALAIRAVARSRRASARVGVHSGEVLVRRLGSDAFDEYDAVGPAVHLAARMEQGAQAGKIHLSAATANLVAGRFSLRALGSRAAKGIPDEIQVFELLSKTRRTRWSARSRQRLSPFVNRAAELNRLIAFTIQGEPVITVLGEPGCGKSRLLHEFARRPELARWTILKAEIEADEAGAGLRPFAQMLRTWLKISRHEAADRVRARLDELTANADGPVGDAATLRDDVVALRALLDVNDAAQKVRVESGQIAQALQRLFAQWSRRKRRLLLVEDVHWLNRDGLDFLRLLCGPSADGRMTIILTSRPQPEPLLDFPRTMVLEPLTAADSMNLLDAQLGTSPSFSTLKARIIERAGGVPLFIEELAKFSSESSSPDSVIPDSIHAVIGERIDRLPPPCRTVLRIAAVIGREIPPDVLSHVAACGGVEMMSRLRLLEDVGFLQMVWDDAEPRVLFNHALTREVALAGLLKSERPRIHRAVLEAYEALYAGRLDTLAGELGMHALGAELWPRAEFYLRRAAQTAIDRSNHVSAIQFITEALRALSLSGLGTQEKLTRELGLRLLLRTGYNAIGNYRERLRNLDRAESLARTLSRDDVLPTLWISRAHSLLQLGQTKAAIALCRRTKRVAGREIAFDTLVGVEYSLTRIYLYVGRLRASLAAAERTLAMLQERPDSERHGGGFGSTKVMLLTQLAHAQASLGHIAAARANADTALQAAGRSGRSFDIMLGSYASGVVQLYGGDLTTGIPDLEHGLAASTAESAQSMHVTIASLLAYAYLQAGRDSDALALARRALSIAETSLYHANWPRLFGSIILHSHGLVDEALRLVMSARAAARKGGYRVQLVWCDLIAAELRSATDATAALRDLARARRASEEIGLRPCLVRALIDTAQLRRKADKDDEAGRLLQRAANLSRTMGPRWIDAVHFAATPGGRPFSR